VFLTPVRLREVYIEYFSERVFVGHAEETKGADRHVNVDGIEVFSKYANRAPSVENFADGLYRARVDLP
jgi:hypothetical protein